LLATTDQQAAILVSEFPVGDQFLLADARGVKIAGADGAVVVESKNLQEKQAARF